MVDSGGITGIVARPVGVKENLTGVHVGEPDQKWGGKGLAVLQLESVAKISNLQYIEVLQSYGNPIY